MQRTTDMNGDLLYVSRFTWARPDSQTVPAPGQSILSHTKENIASHSDFERKRGGLRLWVRKFIRKGFVWA